MMHILRCKEEDPCARFADQCYNFLDLVLRLVEVEVTGALSFFSSGALLEAAVAVVLPNLDSSSLLS